MSEKPYQIIFEIEGLPPTGNIRGRTWGAIHGKKKRWLSESRDTAEREGPPPEPLKKAKVVLTRFSSVQPDFENLTYSFKAVLDGLKAAGVIADDSPKYIGYPTYQWTRIKGNEGKIRVEVYEVVE